jgi:arsenate reductase
MRSATSSASGSAGVRQLRVLFLCTGNSARSIIAEALLRNLGGADFDVNSAGTHPKGINPFTVKVLDQAGLNSPDFRSKSMDEYLDETFDYVITVCDDAAERCPVFPGDPERIHWSFVDPAAVEGEDVVKLAAFQATLREMRLRLESFIPVALRTFAEA